jgi:hypothetical protein
VEIERAIKKFPNVGRRMREILWEWYNPCLEKVIRGAPFSKDN